MSHNKPAATTGLTWLEHSLIAFNGSGYADRTEPERFVDSYIWYKRWKKDSKAVALAIDYYDVVLPLALKLIETSSGGGQTPSEKSMAKFRSFTAEHNVILYD